jgi:multidrug resistance efflux pump
MIAFVSICYAGLYYLIFNVFGLLRKTAANIFAFAGVGVAIIAAIVFTWYTVAPISPDGRVFRYVIPIVPNVGGQVVEVPITGLEMLEQGDVLFRIDPEPYAIAVRQAEAQIARAEAERRLAKTNRDRAVRLVKVQSAAQADLDTWTANLEVAEASIAAGEAQLANAQWRLDETVVRAPTDGYVVNLQLRPGSFVTSVPMASSMAFVAADSNTVLASFSQSSVRKIAIGDAAEVVFRGLPGQTFAGTVARVVAVSGQSQMTASGTIPSLSGAPVTDRWGVLIELEDTEAAKDLAQGAAATVAIYTQFGKAVHMISKVAIRMNAWLGYLTSP